MLRIRSFRESDAQALWELKFRTIREVNIADYGYELVCAWAPDNFEADVWFERISTMDPFVAVSGESILGFADLQDDGYIDHFYCDKDSLGTGVGRLLMQHILSEAQSKKLPRLFSHASITAKPFYERFGFAAVKEQKVQLHDQVLTNYVMENWLESS